MDPQLGAFTSVDPLVGQTGQPYLYANGSPTTLSDPSGLDPGWAHDADPCNDAGYYTCVTAKAGANVGKKVVTGQGRRQKAEKANGVGLSPMDLVSSGGCLPTVEGLGPSGDCRAIPNWVTQLTAEDTVALYWGFFDVAKTNNIRDLDNSISRSDLETVADPANGYPEPMRRAAQEYLDRGLGDSLLRGEGGCDGWCWVATGLTAVGSGLVAGGLCFLSLGFGCAVAGGIAVGMTTTVHSLAKDNPSTANEALCQGAVKTIKGIAARYTGGALAQLGEYAALAVTGC